MNSINVKINKSFYYKNSVNCKEHADKNSSKTVFENKDSSNISDDAAISYKFLSSIESSVKNKNKISALNDCASEYKKIKEEIKSGAYGKDVNKYMDLLNNAFKSALNDVGNSISNIFNKNKSGKTSHIKMSSSALIKCQKQYETGTSIIWMFNAENKRILQEIEYYKKKKNHHKVFLLTQMSNSCKNIIDNVSDTVDYIKSNIDDSLISYSDQNFK